MKIATALLIAISSLLGGCTASRLTPTTGHATARLEVKLSLAALSEGQGSLHAEGPARLYVDGVYVGDCIPESAVVLQVPAGRHRVSLEMARAWDSVGNDHWAVALSGRESLVVLGGESTQQLVFAKHNLKKRRLRV